MTLLSRLLQQWPATESVGGVDFKCVVLLVCNFSNNQSINLIYSGNTGKKER